MRICHYVYFCCVSKQYSNVSHKSVFSRRAPIRHEQCEIYFIAMTFQEVITYNSKPQEPLHYYFLQITAQINEYLLPFSSL